MKLVTALERSVPFRQNEIEKLLQIELVPGDDWGAEDRDALFGTAGVYGGIVIERAHLRTIRTVETMPAMLVLDLSPQCGSFMASFQSDSPPEITVSAPHEPLLTWYSYRRPWGKLTFGAKAIDLAAGRLVSCVVSIGLKPDAYENEIRERLSGSKLISPQTQK